MYGDDSFSVLCCASCLSQINVLEAVDIHLLKADTCIQKEFVTSLTLYTKILFTLNCPLHCFHTIATM